jgi:HK97 family phage major capsid protein
MSSKEVREYRLSKALRACLTPSESGLEAECSRAIETSIGRSPSSRHAVFVPLEIQTRDLTVASAGAGGYLVGSETISIVAALRAKMVTRRLGAIVEDAGLGNGTFPKLATGASVSWLGGEAAAIAESTPTTSQIAFTPKSAGSYIELSRQLIYQISPEAEAALTRDLGAAVAVGIDTAALAGTGASGQPTGIVNTVGIGTVAGTTLGWAGITEFEEDVSTANALLSDQSFGYATTPAIRKLLKGREKIVGGGVPIWDGATMNGYAALATTGCPSATMIGGDWSQIVIATWGILEIEVNPVAAFAQGIVGMRAIYSVDVGLRYPAAFSVATSIT